MRDVFVLLKRDLKNSINKRLLIMFVLLVLFQFWFILASDSTYQVKTSGVMHYMAVVFSFNFFGSIVALALNYDGISRERESKLLDLILTSGVTKKKVYLSKILTSFIISYILALSYVLVLTLVYLVLSGDVSMSLLTLRYILPLTTFLSLFSLMGLMFSVFFRSSKSSLITSIIIGAVFMPRLFVMIIDSLGNLLGFSQRTTEILYMISPALIMNALNGYSEMSYVIWALLFFCVYLTVVIIGGLHVFMRQDELNYGE
ncbi:ABC transporter permease subunit [Eubacteriaceae bacterium ES2]|nr:ABC transporter permease subunit [Eubacteriaceae bacterium ES2]